MYRKVVVPTMAMAAMLSIVFVIFPAGAVGSDKALTRSSGERVFMRSTTINSPVAGSVQVYGGSIDVQDVIEGDLLAFGGDVTFSGHGRVKGNVVFAGGKIINGEGRIGGEAYPLASLGGAATSITKMAVILSLLFVWLCAAVVVTLASGREVRFSSTEIRVSALHCFIVGLVAMTSFVLTAIAFSYLVPYLIGIPMLAALAVFAILAKIYGMVAVFHAVGTAIAGYRTREQLAARKWLRGDVAMVVAGVFILGAIRLIPVVGTIAWSAASVFGIGVALATKFGRREPWFLAWRPAEA
ncbi:MAG TPA: hypothetical protein VLV78_03785 [Thermoanaerobaculia bacterium]|nr:hypothetical protein [Thermoanaerobaculia bacterium]